MQQPIADNARLRQSSIATKTPCPADPAAQTCHPWCNVLHVALRSATSARANRKLRVRGALIVLKFVLTRSPPPRARDAWKLFPSSFPSQSCRRRKWRREQRKLVLPAPAVPAHEKELQRREFYSLLGPGADSLLQERPGTRRQFLLRLSQAPPEA